MAIIKCVCEHKVQDKLHGKGMRVANKTRSGGHRCTVCGKDIAGTNKGYGK